MGASKLNQSFNASSKIKQNKCQTLLDCRISQLDGIIDISDDELEDLSYNQCLNEDLSADQSASLVINKTFHDDLCKTPLSYNCNDGESYLDSEDDQYNLFKQNQYERQDIMKFSYSPDYQINQLDGNSSKVR